MPALRSTKGGTLSGTLPSGVGHTAETDARGIDAEYLRNEASKSLFLGQMFLVLAAHASFAVFMLAATWHAYGAAVALSVPSAFFWRNAISECWRASRLFIASNLNQNA